MQTLTINIEKKADLENVYIANFNGAFDGGVNEPLHELEQLIQVNDTALTIILDFTNLSFLNSYAIGQLVAWYNHIKKNEGAIMIINSNDNIADILNIVGVSKLFKIFPKVDDALATLK